MVYLTVVLIYISLVMSDVEHLFRWLLVIYVSSLDRCLFRSSIHFWVEWIVFFDFEFHQFSSVQLLSRV